MSDRDQAVQRIAPDVRLGEGVKIYGFVNLYGCEIGDEVKIVGAGSVVTKDVPPQAVVAGNPARILRRLPRKD